MEEITTKVCSKCKQDKSITEFYMDNKTIDGYKVWCKDCFKLYKQKYYMDNKIEISIKRKEFKINNSIKVKNQRKKSDIKNKLHKRDYSKLYFQQNKTQINQKKRLKYKTDFNYRLIVINRNRVNETIKNKTCSSIDLFCCTPQEVRNHLEQQFRDGMNWINYGSLWHIDHIIPLDFFDLNNSTEQKIANHWGNLQPLLVHENISKGDNIPTQTNFKYL